MIWAALKMALALGLITIFLIFLVRVFKKWEGGSRPTGADTGIRVLASKLIAPQKYVSLVEIGGEVLALGVSAQQITFLTKIENREMIARHTSHPALRPEALSWLKALSPLQRKGKGKMGSPHEE